jgi:hypothetical protein
MGAEGGAENLTENLHSHFSYVSSTRERLHDVFLEIVKRLNFSISVKGDTFEQYR